MIRDCAVCGERYTAQNSRSTYCSDRCRKRNQRSGATTVTSLEPKPGPLVTVTARHLSLANALDTPAGQLALLLAWAMESPYESGSGVAALSKELTRVMQIIEGEQVTRDPLDELQARRVRNGRCGLASAVASSRQKLNEYPTTSGDPEGNAGF